MTGLLKKAKEIMLENKLSLAVVSGNLTFTSELKGITPVLELLRSDAEMLCGASVSDKVIGKAAALLFAYGGVKEVYAGIISEPALKTLNSHNITAEYEQKVPLIKNSTAQGLCPMEASVMFVDDAKRGYEILSNKIK